MWGWHSTSKKTPGFPLGLRVLAELLLSTEALRRASGSPATGQQASTSQPAGVHSALRPLWPGALLDKGAGRPQLAHVHLLHSLSAVLWLRVVTNLARLRLSFLGRTGVLEEDS